MDFLDKAGVGLTKKKRKRKKRKEESLEGVAIFSKTIQVFGA